MEKTVFRKSSLESLNSPEQLNDYIKAASPAVWIVLAAIIAFLCAVFAWIFFGCIYTRVQGVAVNNNGTLSCYVRAEDMLKAGESVKVSVNGADYTVTEILSAVEGSLAPVSCLETPVNVCPRREDCKTLPLWMNLNRRIQDYLNSVTLADVVAGNIKE